MLSGEFVVKAIFTFIYEQFICFVTEYMMGGDFSHILQDYGYLDNDVAKFYIAEIVLALEYLHGLGIIHRDLKPENLLLDQRGHIKLTDFGLSETGVQAQLSSAKLPQKQTSEFTAVMDKMSDISFERSIIYNNKFDSPRVGLKPSAFRPSKKESIFKEEDDNGSEVKCAIKATIKGPHRLIGTPDYMAPEIIRGISISHKSLDWWALGVMIFEFLTGFPPFNDDSAEKVYENILNLRIPWDQLPEGWESMIDAEAVDIITKLLNPDYEKRFGANNVNEIKKHPWFQGIDWANIRKLEAPILPALEIQSSLPGSKTQLEDLEDIFGKKSSNKISSIELHDILKHLNKEDSHFQTNRFDILDDCNQKYVEELKERISKEVEEKIQKYKINVGYQEESEEDSDDSDPDYTDFKIKSNMNATKATDLGFAQE